ncbi:MAG: NDP-sugar synthase [Cystobacterineae bacterium]|nr:NDP-sugar synthase [Cystobacterineae bacterium]
MKVAGLVLCAGKGTRLEALTQRWPKPAIPLLGQPLLRFPLALLAKAGIGEVGVNVHHLSEKMEETARAEAGRMGLQLVISHEEELLGTGGGLRELTQRLKADVWVVVNGDVVLSMELGPVIEAHLASGADASLLMMPMPEGAAYNPVEVDGEGRVCQIAGHGPGGVRTHPWHFMGLYVLSPGVLPYLDRPGFMDIAHDIFPRMVEDGRFIRAHCLDNPPYWSDVGTYERFLQTHHDLMAGRVDGGPFFPHWPWRTPTPEAIHLEGEVCFGRGVVLTPPLWIAGRRLNPGQLGPFVSVGAGVQLSQGQRFQHAALLEGATLLDANGHYDSGIAVGEQWIAVKRPSL